MLSYIHEYHAGNFADVFKHSLLAGLMENLCKKDKAFTVIDTHAASAIYDLNDQRLLKTGEAANGILKLIESKDNSYKYSQLLQSYLTIENSFIKTGKYAGSPAIEEAFIRPQDTLFLIEKHPQAIKSLKENAGKKSKIVEGDSWESLKALTPPLVKRGLIFMDPSYEAVSDYAQVTESLTIAMKKWNTATIALWYPLLLRKKNECNQMISTLEDKAKVYLPGKELFHSELIIGNGDEMNEDGKAHMYGCGMLIINSPYQFQEKAEECRAVLQEIFKN